MFKIIDSTVISYRLIISLAYIVRIVYFVWLFTMTKLCNNREDMNPELSTYSSDILEGRLNVPLAICVRLL